MEKKQAEVGQAVLIHKNTAREFYVREQIALQICPGPCETEMMTMVVL